MKRNEINILFHCLDILKGGWTKLKVSGGMILNSNNETLLYFIMFRFIPLYYINPNEALTNSYSLAILNSTTYWNPNYSYPPLFLVSTCFQDLQDFCFQNMSGTTCKTIGWRNKTLDVRENHTSGGYQSRKVNSLLLINT
jgi:hypothetical protein